MARKAKIVIIEEHSQALFVMKIKSASMNYCYTIACHTKLYSISIIHLILFFPQSRNINSSGIIKNAAVSAVLFRKENFNFVNHMITMKYSLPLPQFSLNNQSIHFLEISQSHPTVTSSMLI